MHIRPLVLRTVVFFIVLNAAVAAATLFSGDERFGDIDGNIMMTTVIMTAAGLLFLVCFLAYEDRRPQPLPALPAFAVAAILVGLVLVLLHVWADIDSTLLDRATLTVVIVAFGTSLICLISLASLRFPYGGVQVAAALLAVALATVAIYMVWNPDRTDQHWRIAALLAVFTASTTQVIPVMAYLLKVREPAGRRATPRRPSYCPNCGAVLHMDDPYCLACGVSFRVEFLRERRMNPYQRQAAFAQRARELAEQEAEEPDEDFSPGDDAELETAPLLPERPLLTEDADLDADLATARTAVIDGYVESTSVIPAPSPWSRTDIAPPGELDEALDSEALAPPPIDPLLDPSATTEEGSNGADLDREGNETRDSFAMAIENALPHDTAAHDTPAHDTPAHDSPGEDGWPLTPDNPMAEAATIEGDAALEEPEASLISPAGGPESRPNADADAGSDDSEDSEDKEELGETPNRQNQSAGSSGGKKRRSRRRKSRR